MENIDKDAAAFKINTGTSYMPLIGNKINAGTSYMPLIGGTHVTDGGAWYRYRENINFDIQAYAEGASIRLSIASQPNETNNAQGTYRFDGEVMRANFVINITAHRIAYPAGEPADITFDISPSEIECSGTSQPFTHLMPGSKIVSVAINNVAVSFSGTEKYKLNLINTGTHIWTLNASATVYPSGAGVANVSNAHPPYGTQISLAAGETNRDAWRFQKWASGRTTQSYSVVVYDDYSDVAQFYDASHIIDMEVFISIGQDEFGTDKIFASARTLQNRTEQIALLYIFVNYKDIEGVRKETNADLLLPCDGNTATGGFNTSESSIQNITNVEVRVVSVPHGYVLGEININF